MEKDMFREYVRCWEEGLKRLCKDIASLDPVKRHFFLTGGTALAVFWLGHRKTDNLDFFTTDDVDFLKTGRYFKNIYGSRVIAANDQCILIRDDAGRISLAKDDLSIRTKRPLVLLEGVPLRIDTMANLMRNKMSAFVSRFSRNDAIDVLSIIKRSADKERTATKMITEARKVEILAEDTTYILCLLEDLPREYPDVATAFEDETKVLRDVLLDFDRAIDEIYR